MTAIGTNLLLLFVLILLNSMRRRSEDIAAKMNYIGSFTLLLFLLKWNLKLILGKSEISFQERTSGNFRKKKKIDFLKFSWATRSLSLKKTGKSKLQEMKIVEFFNHVIL